MLVYVSELKALEMTSYFWLILMYWLGTHRLLTEETPALIIAKGKPRVGNPSA